MINLKDEGGKVVRTIYLSQNVMLAALKKEFTEVQYGSRTTAVYKRLVGTGRYVDAGF